METLKIRMVVGTTVVSWPALPERRSRPNAANIPAELTFKPANDQAAATELRAGLRIVAQR